MFYLEYFFYLFIKICRYFIKINSECILFVSNPDLSDNSLALTEYLIKNGYSDKYQIYWAVKDPYKYSRLELSSHVSFIHRSGIRKVFYLKTYLSAGWLFATHDFVIKYNNTHPQNQHYIRLWHGCSYKDKDAYAKSRNNQSVQFDKALVPGVLFVDIKQKIWNCRSNQIIAKGYPRYDWLINTTDEARNLYKKIKGNNNKVLIWMPTFRIDKNNVLNDTQNITKFPIISNNLDWHKLDNYCSNVGVIILVKLHPLQKDYVIKWESFNNIKLIDDNFFHTAKTTLYSFLSTTDGLITDYSSVGIDYMIVDKPIAFTLDDFELYKDGRGFVFPDPRIYMPGHHLLNTNDLISFVKDISLDLDKYAKNRREMFDLLIYKSDHYCKDIVEELGL